MKKMFLLSFVVVFLAMCTNKKLLSVSDAEIASTTLTEIDSIALVQIDSTILGKNSFDGYSNALQFFPAQHSEYFPGQKATITQMIETEILSEKAASLEKDFISTKNWEWQQIYYPAQIYFQEHLPSTLGFSETELQNYYNENLEEFKQTIVFDSTGRDSTFYYSYENSIDYMAQKLFIAKYPPDSAFLSNYPEDLTDTATVNDEWISSIRSNLSDFFMKEFFLQQYGKTYPDSLSEIYGTGKTITPEDVEIVLSWLPKDQRDSFKNDPAPRDLINWLLKWKLFYNETKKTSLQVDFSMEKTLYWALKINLVNKYIESELIPKLPNDFVVDTAMLEYALYDDGISPVNTISENDISDKIAHLNQLYRMMFFDSLLISLRSEKNIKFLQSEYTDYRDVSSSTLLHDADSLHSIGLVNEAEKLYTTLTEDFLIKPEGKKALLNLAKLQTEQQLSKTAINTYRKYLLLIPNDGNRCNIFFMIGFIYDEQFDNPELAEVNYKWILKNTPNCELAKDTEFMLLHLDEPMSTVEELRAEALRQGRKIDMSEEDAADSTNTK